MHETKQQETKVYGVEMVFLLVFSGFFIFSLHSLGVVELSNGNLLRWLIPSLMCFCIIAYLIGVILLHIGKRRAGSIIRWASLLGLFIVSVGILSCAQIYYRAHGNPYAIHDGALQNEAAFDQLMKGQNPYAISYYDTFPEGQWRQVHVGNLYVLNPALEHYIYLPAMFLIDGVIGKAELALLGFRDSRILFMASALVCFALLVYFLRGHPWLSTVLILFFYNTLFVKFLVEGRNDIFLVMLLFLSFILLVKKRWLFAGMLFGVACATKQFALLFIPMLAAYFFYLSLQKRQVRAALSFWLPALGVALIFILPFFLWNPGAFIDDVLLYPGGASLTLNYPISGFGPSNLLTLAGFPPNAYFPFWIPILIVGLMFGILGMRAVYRTGTVSSVALAGSLLLFSTIFFSRVTQDSYVILCIQLILVWFALMHREQPSV